MNVPADWSSGTTAPATGWRTHLGGIRMEYQHSFVLESRSSSCPDCNWANSKRSLHFDTDLFGLDEIDAIMNLKNVTTA